MSYGLTDALLLARVRSQIAQAIQPSLEDCAAVLTMVERLRTALHRDRTEIAQARAIEPAFAHAAATLNHLFQALVVAGLSIHEDAAGWFAQWQNNPVAGPYPDLADAVTAAWTEAGLIPLTSDE